jgi:alanine racemase
MRENRAVTQEHATAVIDLGALARNVERIKSHVAGPEVMVIVKADGYGHGLVPSAKAAVAGGATWLGVALLQEAIAYDSSQLPNQLSQSKTRTILHYFNRCQSLNLPNSLRNSLDNKEKPD